VDVATLNVGSGTVKAALAQVVGDGSRIVRRETIAWREPDALGPALREALGRVVPDGRVAAVAHRVVHGGDAFTRPVRVDDEVERRLEALSALAPLHGPPALEGLRAARRALPGVPAVAVFDTAFHVARPRASRVYALPPDVAGPLGIRRYGFHGLAHASLLASLARASAAWPSSLDAVTLQLGSGCSACAIARGSPVETSMGFTPLEGLVMATRSGDVDPSVVLYLLRQGRSVDEVEALLNRGSGLRGLAGAADVRDVLRAEERGEERAALAMDVFVRRIVATVGAYLTLLDGRGDLVFGGGIGTHSAEVRRRIAAGLRAWDVTLDEPRHRADPTGRVSAPGSRAVWVFETDEESILAREAASVL